MTLGDNDLPTWFINYNKHTTWCELLHQEGLCLSEGMGYMRNPQTYCSILLRTKTSLKNSSLLFNN